MGDTGPRVAVIVVHGVADQAPGDTARAFVNLMVAAGGRDGAHYESRGSEPFTLPVPLPMPHATTLQYSAEVSAEVQGIPAEDPPKKQVLKPLRQSWSSDFHYHGLDLETEEDTGLAFTNYLVNKAHRHRMPPETFASERHSLLRQGAEGSTHIDVHELYWADLSRLSGSSPRIVTEVFTLIFRLSRLARDTVERASVGGNKAWRLLHHAQAAVDWILVNVMAQFFALLLGVGLYLVAVGLLTGGTPLAVKVTVAVALTLLFGGLLGLAYFSRGAPQSVPASAPALVAALMAVATGLSILLLPEWTVAPAVLAILVLAYLAALQAGNRRFPGVWHIGVLLLVLVLGFVLARMLGFLYPVPSSTSARDLWLDGGMTALEAVLKAIKFTWTLLAATIFVWAVLSLVLSAVAWAGNDLQRRASAATGRLGLLLSLTTLLVVTMALWAALNLAVTQPLKDHNYEPVFWKTEAAAAPNVARSSGSELGTQLPYAAVPPQSAASSTSAAGKCKSGATEKSRPSDAFVDCRYRGTTQTFPVIVLLMGVLGLYLVATVVPSLLAELRLTRSKDPVQARRLGLWLTVCYRWLDRVVALVTLMAALAALAVVAWWLAKDTGLWTVPDSWASLLEQTSQSWLGLLTITATSALAVLSLLGGVLSRVLPGLRVPLDVALDVDNYMREFPRNAIPRVRMLARAQALFDALARGGYDRVVVVSHSQGTVLASETLRWMSSQSLGRDQPGRAIRLKKRLNCASVRLLTLGSPLRQLYAARFPKLYAWVLADHADRNGPRAEDVGVERWANAFGSGDYVGRWLWARRVKPPRKYHPLIDDLEPGLGRALAYDAFDPMPPDIAALQHQAEFETCVGYDAHTHYFDLPGSAGETQVVALLADDLIALP